MRSLSPAVKGLALGMLGSGAGKGVDCAPYLCGSRVVPRQLCHGLPKKTVPTHLAAVHGGKGCCIRHHGPQGVHTPVG